MRRRFAAVGIVGLVLVARAAFAQDPPPPTTPLPAAPRDAPEVRVVGDKADSLQKVPGSGTVISTKEIERSDPYDTAEMLRRVPGLQVRQDEGGGLRLDIGVRGLDPGRSRHVLILEDGIPIAINPYAEPDLYYAPQIERMAGIEVVKGSGSILFGPQTTGGVINFYTKMPPRFPHATVDLQAGNLGYSRVLGSYGDSVGDHTRYFLQVFNKHGDGIRGEAFNVVDVFGKVVFDTSDKGEATLKLGFHDNQTLSDDVGLTRAMWESEPRRQTLAPNDKSKLRRYEASLVHEQRFTENTKLRTLVYGYITDRIWRRQDYSRNFLPGTSFDRVVGADEAPLGGAIYFLNSNTILDRDYQVAGIEPRLEHRLKTGDIAHTIDVGTRFLTESAHYQQRAGDFPTSFAGANNFEETHRSYAAAMYLQDRIAFTESLLLTPGVRYEHVNFHKVTTRAMTATGAQDQYIAGDVASDALVPGVGVIYGSRSAHVFSGVHVGYAPPRIASSISPKGTPAALDPEKSYNYEVGSRFNHKRWLHLEGTFFFSTFTNQAVTGTGDTGGSELVNGGKTRHIGFESAAVLGIGRLADLAKRFEVDFGLRYTYNHASFVGGRYDGLFLPYAPEHSFTATVDVEHPTGVAGQVAWTHVSNQFTDQANTVATDVTGRYGRMPAWNAVDLGARYRHKPTGITLRLTVKNALDDPYIVARRPEGIFASGFRQIMLGLRWDWEKPPAPSPGVAAQ